MVRLILAFIVSLVVLDPLGSAQDKDKKNGKKSEPSIHLIVPLGAAPGTTTRLTIRGKHLDKATAVKLPEGLGSVQIISKGPAPVPDKNPDQVGDTQVVIDLMLAAKVPNEPLLLRVTTSDGDAKPHPLLVETALPLLKEKEPNEGFKQAQELQLPALVEAVIDRPKDVDVFRFQGKAGQKVIMEVLAHRFGSPLDAMITLYDAKGNQLAENDDFGPGADSKLEVVLRHTGIHHLVVIDAHDQGSVTHVYRLIIK